MDMFDSLRPQRSLFETSMLLPPSKLAALKKTWVWTFREEALPLIDGELFRPLYCADNGRPSKPVELVVGVLILKDMFDLTDAEALYRLDFDLGWQVALGVESEEAHCCQKTLHNFRARLMGSDGGLLLFTDTAGKVIAKLGVSTGRQRMDSTHFLSNIAHLTRLGLFCETIRVFLAEVSKAYPERYAKISVALRCRYIKEDGEASGYADARSSEAVRRLSVCGRDVWRLLEHFRGDTAVASLAGAQLLQRLFVEQCEVAPEAAPADAGDADVEESFAPVVVKPPKQVSSDSMQTPHDPIVTYNGHKGQGYEAQIAETCGNADKPEVITYVEPGPSCQSDKHRAVPTVTDLVQRGLGPDTMVADTTYGATENVIACAALGTDLQSPAGGREAAAPSSTALTVGDFDIDLTHARPPRCPAGHEAIEHTRDEATVEAVFDGSQCAQCPQRETCPTTPRDDGHRELKTSLHTAVLERRRRYQATPEFQQEYNIRAGIEATNSELKRGQGLGKLRVRGSPAVSLAVYLKCTACNLKRMVAYFTRKRTMAHVMG
jgi:hypothetical protein